MFFFASSLLQVLPFGEDLGGVAVAQNIGINSSQIVGFTQADRDRLIRMEVTLEQFMKATDQRFEQVDQRFEQVDSRIQWQFGILISAMFILVGFILWDRRTFLKPFETKAKEIETIIELKSTRMEKILSTLRELAKTDSKVAEALRTYNLL